MRRCFFPIIALLIAGCGTKEPTAPSEAPAGLVLKTADGDKALNELAKDGPVFLYFTKATCGSNPEAVPLVQSVFKPYEGKVKMYAVVNAPVSEYGSWKEQYGLTMPGAGDEDKALVRHFGFAESQHVVMVEKGGQAREIKGGFGRPALEELNRERSVAAMMKPADVDLTKAPPDAAYG